MVRILLNSCPLPARKHLGAAIVSSSFSTRLGAAAGYWDTFLIHVLPVYLVITICHWSIHLQDKMRA
ncbi:hypothetical protein V6Z12_A08G091400 [Gossypium hirsutum]